VRDPVVVGLYLGAIVAANTIIAHFGPWALPFTAWVLIPFDLVARDVLHERWHGDALWFRMAALVVAGCALSALVNLDAWRIALASCIAFGANSVTNAAVYETLWEEDRLVRMNASNFFASIIDSATFPLVAFSLFDPLLLATQTGSKFFGGLGWSLAYVTIRKRGRNADHPTT
jgi:uncharacterized PurR-regulated membrane protein YhhQ (DUF165 family)